MYPKEISMTSLYDKKFPNPIVYGGVVYVCAEIH